MASLAPPLAMRLYLQCALVADSCGEESDAYEFMTQGFVTYEEEISDSRAQFAALTCAQAALHHTANFTSDNYETLATKATQYSARLMKKPDQCRAVCRASFMWSQPAGDGDGAPRDPKRVLECLQKSLKIADACKASATHLPLFVEILEAYVLHFSKGNEAIVPKFVTSLVQLIEQQLDGAPNAAFDACKRGIERRKTEEPRWAEVEV